MALLIIYNTGLHDLTLINNNNWVSWCDFNFNLQSRVQYL